METVFTHNFDRVGLAYVLSSLWSRIRWLPETRDRLSQTTAFVVRLERDLVLCANDTHPPRVRPFREVVDLHVSTLTELRAFVGAMEDLYFFHHDTVLTDRDSLKYVARFTLEALEAEAKHGPAT